MYHVIFEKYAENDLFEILSYYTLQGGLELAHKINKRIEKQINILSQSPNIYMNCPLEPRLKQFHIQKLPYKVYYLVNDETRTIHIFAILHHSRDHKRIFEDLNYFSD